MSLKAIQVKYFFLKLAIAALFVGAGILIALIAVVIFGVALLGPNAFIYALLGIPTLFVVLAIDLAFAALLTVFKERMEKTLSESLGQGGNASFQIGRGNHYCLRIAGVMILFVALFIAAVVSLLVHWGPIWLWLGILAVEAAIFIFVAVELDAYFRKMDEYEQAL